MFLAEIEAYVNKLDSLKAVQDFIAWDTNRRLTVGASSVPDPLPPRLPIVQRVVVVPPVYEDGSDVEDDHTLPHEATFRPLSCDEVTH